MEVKEYTLHHNAAFVFWEIMNAVGKRYGKNNKLTSNTAKINQL